MKEDFNLDISDCTSTTISNNKYHDDDMINQFLEHVRYAKLESDAIRNIPKIIERYTTSKKEADYKFISGMIIGGLLVYIIIDIITKI